MKLGTFVQHTLSGDFMEGGSRSIYPPTPLQEEDYILSYVLGVTREGEHLGTNFSDTSGPSYFIQRLQSGIFVH